MFGTINSKSSSIEKYIEEKIDMIEYEFRIRMSQEDKMYIRGLKTEISVDNWATSYIVHKLSEDEE